MSRPLFFAALAVLVFLVGCRSDAPRAHDGELADDEQVAESTIDPPTRAPTAAWQEDGVQTISITVRAGGYEPESIALEARVPARLVFTRVDDGACAERIQIPAYDIESTYLPLNEGVTLEFVPLEGGVFQFVCGMDMLRGRMVVSE